MNIYTEADIRRFYEKVVVAGPDECWDWIGGNRRKDGQGYGNFYYGELMSAHRFAFWIATGHHPGNLCVCHHCDRPVCVNPSHLFLGTHKDNMQDSVCKGRKDRVNSGESHGASKLTEDQVCEIRARYEAGGVFQRELATEYGVCRASVGLIVQRKNWKHI